MPYLNLAGERGNKYTRSNVRRFPPATFVIDDLIGCRPIQYAMTCIRSACGSEISKFLIQRSTAKARSNPAT